MWEVYFSKELCFVRHYCVDYISACICVCYNNQFHLSRLSLWYVIYWHLRGRVSSGISKQEIHLGLKVNKRELKCHMNCFGRMLEGRVRNDRKRYNEKMFNPEKHREWQRAESSTEETLYVTPPCALIWRGQMFPGWEVREKSKCTRLTNIDSEYDPRTKKKRKWEDVLNQSSWRQNEEETNMIKCFKSALYQPRGSRAKM